MRFGGGAQPGVDLVLWTLIAMVKCKGIGRERVPEARCSGVGKSLGDVSGTTRGCVEGGAVCLAGKVFLELGLGCGTQS